VEAKRISRLEGKVEEISKRIDDLKSDISSLRN
jgi:chaperonin cofactor prefoldin